MIEVSTGFIIGDNHQLYAFELFGEMIKDGNERGVNYKSKAKRMESIG